MKFKMTAVGAVAILQFSLNFLCQNAGWYILHNTCHISTNIT